MKFLNGAITNALANMAYNTEKMEITIKIATGFLSRRKMSAVIGWLSKIEKQGWQNEN